MQTAQQLFGQQKGQFGEIFHRFPPFIIKADSGAGLIFLYLLTIIHDVQRPLEALRWIAGAILPPTWPPTDPAKNDTLKVISVVKAKKARTYAVFDTDNWIRVDEGHEGRKLRMTLNAHVRQVTVFPGGKKIQLRVDDGSVKSVPVSNPGDWQGQAPPFPMLLGGLEPPFPPPVLVALYGCLTADDCVVLRSLLHFGVVPVAKEEGVPFAEALLDIFAYSGKMDSFLVTAAGMEFSREELEVSTVLRLNTHLTNLFKVWFRRFGQPYFDLVLGKLIDYVTSFADIGLSFPENSDIAKAETLLFTVIKVILSSASAFPPPIRHLAAVLKNLAVIRFNNKVATYNTLAGFICLRFITAVIADPSIIRPEGESEAGSYSPEIMRVLMPFSQLLQTPINLMTLEDKFAPYAAWNTRLERHVWPKLIKWLLSIGTIIEKPEYETPSREVVFKALELVLTTLSKNFAKFKTHYETFAAQSRTSHPITWSVATLFIQFFEENI